MTNPWDAPQFAVGEEIAWINRAGGQFTAEVVAVEKVNDTTITYTCRRVPLNKEPVDAYKYPTKYDDYVNGVVREHIDESVQHLYEDDGVYHGGKTADGDPPIPPLFRPETVNIRRQPDVAQNRTLVIPEAEGTKLITVLHNDGAATVIRIEPHHDGIELSIDLGWGKALHDLQIHRNGADIDDDG